jgi:uncharacterized membrane protein YdjX (TVP38/TMEM64 family)
MKPAIVNRIIIVLVIVLLIVAFRVLHLEQYLTLAYLKSSREQFALLYAQRTVLVIAGYMLIYTVATALSMPGAAILTLAGGALFGQVTGTIVVSFASTIGATLACLVSRYLLRDWVQARFGDKLQRINEGMEREGGWYLFTLRLIPVFPFFVINLLMGLTPIRLFTYYWVSQLGMLPATIVYVNAGRELGRLESLAGILSPSLIFSFVLLGLFPIVVKKIMNRLNKAGKAQK